MPKGCPKDAPRSIAGASREFLWSNTSASPGDRRGREEGASCYCRHVIQTPDDRPGAQPLGCRNTGLRCGTSKSPRAPQVSRFCSLKAALLGDGGSVEIRTRDKAKGFCYSQDCPRDV